MPPTLADLSQERIVHATTAPQCTHRRIVDEVLTTTGTKTGRLICKECLAVFPDPTFQEPGC